MSYTFQPRAGSRSGATCTLPKSLRVCDCTSRLLGPMLCKSLGDCIKFKESGYDRLKRRLRNPRFSGAREVSSGSLFGG
jgi:hypothetical protein